MTTHSTFVSAGHGDTSSNTGAKKNPVPTYQADPVRSAAMTARSQTGGDWVGGWFAGFVRMIRDCPHQVIAAIT
ncbi:hypothetical protein MPHO_05980 [Mycolicibacterium phocaicum]|nr:hypothetical protein MPHO_05980 [Mycolicibacterium phocaicum]